MDDFIEAFNYYRVASYSPSDRIRVDESISRWYGLGGHWKNVGIPKYVAMERKPDNVCEILDPCDGRSKVMVRLNLVKGYVDKELLANEDRGDLYGTRVMKQLVAPWSSSGIVVCAESYFASVSFAIAMCDMGLWLLFLCGLTQMLMWSLMLSHS